MAAKPKTNPKPKPAAPKHQAGRKQLRMSVTLDADCKRQLERIRAEVPGLDSLSAAIRYAAGVAEAALPLPA